MGQRPNQQCQSTEVAVLRASSVWSVVDSGSQFDVVVSVCRCLCIRLSVHASATLHQLHGNDTNMYQLLSLGTLHCTANYSRHTLLLWTGPVMGGLLRVVQQQRLGGWDAHPSSYQSLIVLIMLINTIMNIAMVSEVILHHKFRIGSLVPTKCIFK